MSKTPTAKFCPVMEAISKKLFGFDLVDCAEQARMIKRAAKAGAEAAKQKRFSAEDVRQISIELLDIMKVYAPAEDKELKHAESAFVLLYDRLLSEEKKR